MTPGTDSPDTTSIRLLSGFLTDFLRYSRGEGSKWLVDVAHDICDPVLRRGSVEKQMGPQHWLAVADTDPLTASVYRYHLDAGVTVGLAKISRREGRSQSSTTGNATTMATHVRQRDGRCWVTGDTCPLINSHLCPKRMGDYMARIIFQTFTGIDPFPDLTIFHEMFGLSLTRNLNALFDVYQLGFRYIAPQTYECHVFADAGDEEYDLYATTGDNIFNLPPLHGQRVHPPNPHHIHNPPAGLFRWHYLQCVIKKFGHHQYTNLQNINFHELPLRMEGDSDDDGTDSELQWPSMAFDLGRNVEQSLKESAESHQAVQNWIDSLT